MLNFRRNDDMTMEHLSLLVSFGAFGMAMLSMFKSDRNNAALELKINTMWAFQMRRAVSEVVTSGLGKMNSPLIFSDKAYASLEPIKGDLVTFYEKLPPRTSDLEAMLKIEEIFGDRLLNLVCIPCGLSHGSCLILSLVVAKQQSEIDLKLFDVKRHATTT